jgi:hypothetical protein
MLRSLVVLVVGLAVINADCPNVSASEQSAVPRGPTVRTAMPGPAEQPTAAVRATTDAASYRVGQPIVVTLANDLPDVVYLPMGQTYCSALTVQRRNGEEWAAVGPCSTGAEPLFALVAAHDRLAVVVDSTVPSAQVAGPFVSEPTIPGAFSGEVRALPTTARPGGPIRVVPEGGSPPAPTPSPEDVIGPGTYRIAVTFTVGGFGGTAQTVYSPEFVVIG